VLRAIIFRGAYIGWLIYFILCNHRLLPALKYIRSIKHLRKREGYNHLKRKKKVSQISFFFPTRFPQALYVYEAQDTDELSMNAGDVIEIISEGNNNIL
jgi:hypothetical protein